MKIAIVGCGVMGSAFASSWAKEHQLYLVGRDPHRLEPLAHRLSATITSLEEGCKRADVILLGFKPKDLAHIAQQIAPFLTPEKVVISILTGADISRLSSLLPHAQIVRTMPNLAITTGEGIIGVADIEDPQLKKQVRQLLSTMGLVYFVAENKMEAFTALCGSSPAFIFKILEAMMEAGVAMGFSFVDAKELIMQAFLGSIALLRSTNLHPATLKMQISSPGGTTIAGLREMEKQGVSSGLIEAVFACYHKAEEMKKHT